MEWKEWIPYQWISYEYFLSYQERKYCSLWILEIQMFFHRLLSFN